MGESRYFSLYKSKCHSEHGLWILFKLTTRHNPPHDDRVECIGSVSLPFTLSASDLNRLVHSAMSSSAVFIISRLDGRASSCDD